MLSEPQNIEFPSKESLLEFHRDLNVALIKLSNANEGIPPYLVCGSAFQVILSFPYMWMEQSKTQDRFVENMKAQAEEFVRLKAQAPK